MNNDGLCSADNSAEKKGRRELDRESVELIRRMFPMARIERLGEGHYLIEADPASEGTVAIEPS